jgi:hypothetical protein
LTEYSRSTTLGAQVKLPDCDVIGLRDELHTRVCVPVLAGRSKIPLNTRVAAKISPYGTILFEDLKLSHSYGPITACSVELMPRVERWRGREEATFASDPTRSRDTRAVSEKSVLPVLVDCALMPSNSYGQRSAHRAHQQDTVRPINSWREGCDRCTETGVHGPCLQAALGLALTR